MKVLIIGAGGQGGACASILAGFEVIEEIRLADLSEDTALSVKNKLSSGSEKVITAKVDALSPDAVAELAAGVDVVIDMVMPWMAPYVMKGALKANAHYINTAFDTPYWDELLSGRSPDELTLSAEFRAAGLTALMGCGFAPGWTNILARRFANRLDRVDDIRMRVGKATHLPGEQPYDWVFRPWDPGWSPKQALVDCASPTYSLTDGKFIKHEPFSGLEMCTFPHPVGELPVTHHSHEEIYSMPATFGGVKNIDFKYYLMYQPAMLYAIGLCSEEKIKVGDSSVSPIDVVSALVRPPVDGVFGQSDEELEYADKTSFIELIVSVSGLKDGKRVTWQANCPKMNSPGPELKKLFGTALVYVALPLSIGAIMLCDTDLKKGIIFADEIDPEAFIDRMLATGYPYKWREEQLG
jgi:saccharopine dehydrogenase (NAD+, L-lysine-forming)